MRTRSRPIAAGRCFLVTVGVLVLFTIARQLGWLGPPVVSESILIALLVVVAVSTHATLADLITMFLNFWHFGLDKTRGLGTGHLMTRAAVAIATGTTR